MQQTALGDVTSLCHGQGAGENFLDDERLRQGTLARLSCRDAVQLELSDGARHAETYLIRLLVLGIPGVENGLLAIYYEWGWVEQGGSGC